MKVQSVSAAWEAANRMIEWDYMKDEAASERAGYPIYYSTVEGSSAHISDLGCRLEVNFDNGKTENIWIEPEELGEDVEVHVIAESGETRTYNTYAAYRKDFRFFWSSGKESTYEDGTEKHFEKIIQALRMVNEDGCKMSSNRNGLTTVFTFKKFR